MLDTNMRVKSKINKFVSCQASHLSRLANQFVVLTAFKNIFKLHLNILLITIFYFRD